MTIYAGIKALHLLCAVVWVGGMFFAYVVLRPSMVAIEAPQRMLLHTRVFKKFFLVIWHAMPVILITGFAMLFLMGGMANVPWQIHAMMGLGLLMAAVFLAIFFGPYRQFRRTTDRNRMASTLNSIRRLIGVNLVLGLITVIVAGLL
ncbi:CopD family protein [Acidisphaera sp. S103]|uniref:CopD family protein n=1 Tax=Acidisphaera sp. S103 TaxID=1747223 RepID=UPI00131BB9F4|nr:CopD family protein [Acidisphaera sp. S103]